MLAALKATICACLWSTDKLKRFPVVVGHSENVSFIFLPSILSFFPKRSCFSACPLTVVFHHLNQKHGCQANNILLPPSFPPFYHQLELISAALKVIFYYSAIFLDEFSIIICGFLQTGYFPSALYAGMLILFKRYTISSFVLLRNSCGGTFFKLC